MTFRLFRLGLVLLLAACVEQSTLAIQPQASLSTEAGLAGMIIHVEGRRITAEDFQDSSGSAQVLTIDVPDSGTLEVSIELMRGGQMAASGVARWELEDGYEWGLSIFRQVEDPMQTCFGCRGSVRVPLLAAAQTVANEAIWLVWGGQPNGSDIVY